MFVLQDGDACYSWRLPPPSSLVACGSIQACKKIVRCSGEDIVRGMVLNPWRS